jgi:hypothetical protein
MYLSNRVRSAGPIVSATVGAGEVDTIGVGIGAGGVICALCKAFS